MGNNATTTIKLGWFKEVWNFRELFYFFIWRDIKIRYKQTVLGALWAVIQPFFTMVVFTIFFGNFAKVPSEGVPYPVFSYSALVPWTYFSGALALSGNSLIGNSNLLTKVYFPRFAIPASAALAGILDFFIASILLFGIMMSISMRVFLRDCMISLRIRSNHPLNIRQRWSLSMCRKHHFLKEWMSLKN